MSEVINRKYEFTDKTKSLRGHKLHQIRAVRDFADIKSGTLGGWIEGEGNLSHDGNAWVADEAAVYGKASITGNALISDCAIVSGHAQVSDNAHVLALARVCDSAQVRERAAILDSAMIRGNARIYGGACVADDTVICGRTEVSGCALVHEKARVSGEAKIFGCSEIGGNAMVSGMAKIEGATVCGNAVITKNAFVEYNAMIGGKARINGPDQYLVVGPFGKDRQHITFYRGGDGSIEAACEYATFYHDGNDIKAACQELIFPVDEFPKEAKKLEDFSDCLSAYKKAAECAAAFLGE